MTPKVTHKLQSRFNPGSLISGPNFLNTMCSTPRSKGAELWGDPRLLPRPSAFLLFSRPSSVLCLPALLPYRGTLMKESYRKAGGYLDQIIFLKFTLAAFMQIGLDWSHPKMSKTRMKLL